MNPVFTLSWSSASSTVVWRIRVPSQRHLDPELGAALPLGVDLYAPPNQAHPLVKADQPQATSAPCLGEVEALPVVGDGQLQAVSGRFQGHARLARARMRGDVAQRLLGDAVQTKRNVLRNAIQTVGRSKGDLD